MNRSLWKALAFLAIPGMLLMAWPACHADPASQNSARNSEAVRAEWAERHEQMARQLGLTPEQQKKFQTLRQQGRSQSQAQRQQLRSKRQALMQYLRTPQAMEARALQMQAEVNDLQKQMSEQRIKAWFQMRETLTPEQLQKLGQLKPKRPSDFQPKSNPKR